MELAKFFLRMIPGAAVIATFIYGLILGSFVLLRNPDSIALARSVLPMSWVGIFLFFELLIPLHFVYQSRNRPNDQNRFRRIFSETLRLPSPVEIEEVAHALRNLGYEEVTVLSSNPVQTIQGVRKGFWLAKENGQTTNFNSRKLLVRISAEGAESYLELHYSPVKWIEIADMTQTSYFLAEQLKRELGLP